MKRWLIAVLLVMLAKSAYSVDWNRGVEDLFAESAAQEVAAAALRDDVDSILRLHDLGIDVDSAGEGGITPLFLAVVNSNQRSVRVLLDLNANPDVDLDIGYSALKAALVLRDATLVELLLEHNANPDLVTGQKIVGPPLFDALEGPGIRVGPSQFIDLLLKHGANPNLPSQSGTYVVNFAAAMVRYDHVYQLLQGGAKPHMQWHRGVGILDLVDSRFEHLPSDSEQFPWLMKTVELLREEYPDITGKRFRRIKKAGITRSVY